MPYMKPEVRKEQILDAAIKVAEKNDYFTMRREDIARVAGCSDGSVSRYFGTMNQLRKAVMRHAVHHGHHIIVAQGLMRGDRQARKASQELKNEAASHIASK